MSNKGNQKRREISKNPTLLEERFMELYLKGELEFIGKGGKFRAKTSKNKKRWLLMPSDLRELDLLEDFDVDGIFKFHEHTHQFGKKKGQKFFFFGLKEDEWRNLGIEGKLVKRYVNDIKQELDARDNSDIEFDNQFANAMLAWEADKV